MAQYAANTDVSSDRSRAEIEKTLRRYGARRFMYGYDEHRAIVEFQTQERQVRFVLPLPDPDDRLFTHTPSKGLRRSPAQQEAEYEQAVRQRWRALHLVIKAKLEAVETGIVSFDCEFLAHLVLPNGHTVGDSVVPGVELAYETGEMPALLTNYGLPAIEAAT